MDERGHAGQRSLLHREVIGAFQHDHPVHLRRRLQRRGDLAPEPTTCRHHGHRQPAHRSPLASSGRARRNMVGRLRHRPTMPGWETGVPSATTPSRGCPFSATSPACCSRRGRSAGMPPASSPSRWPAAGRQRPTPIRWSASAWKSSHGSPSCGWPTPPAWRHRPPDRW